MPWTNAAITVPCTVEEEDTFCQTRSSEPETPSTTADFPDIFFPEELPHFFDMKPIIEDVHSPKRKSRRQTSSWDNKQAFSERASGRWTKVENIFLTGVTLDAYYRRHSLKASQCEKEMAESTGLIEEGLVWSKIHTRYETACSRHFALTGDRLPKRTKSALQKHWKEMGSKRKKEVIDGTSVPETKRNERTWDQEFNFDNVLLGSEQKFLFHLERRNSYWIDGLSEKRQRCC